MGDRIGRGRSPDHAKQNSCPMAAEVPERFDASLPQFSGRESARRCHVFSCPCFPPPRFVGVHDAKKRTR